LERHLYFSNYTNSIERRSLAYKFVESAQSPLFTRSLQQTDGQTDGKVISIAERTT